MNKNRLEALSDGVFAIIMTLLVIEIKIPELHHDELTNANLIHKIYEAAPLFFSYFISFTVLSMYWVSHHALYHMFVKNVDRVLIQLNMLYLSFAALIPFSAHLLGSYFTIQTSIIFYGLNILAISLAAYSMLMYALKAKEIDRHEVSQRILKQAKIRITLTPIFALIGIIISFINIPEWNIPIALIFFGFPVLFNIIPGGLNLLEKIFNFRLGE